MPTLAWCVLAWLLASIVLAGTIHLAWKRNPERERETAVSDEQQCAQLDAQRRDELMNQIDDVLIARARERLNASIPAFDEHKGCGALAANVPHAAHVWTVALKRMRCPGYPVQDRQLDKEL